ncbi:MAG: Na/Pi cotransporter family protein [Bacteroidetes bacterium]|nr:MAG: Na/Pi cotransporter family protein [Bacteroidota bacterium]
MDYSIIDFLTLLGALGLFLFGMKLMSEALQKVAGNKMRSILSAMTSNRVKGVLTGVLITAIIQSSSATTVMVVSFVNAGLLSLMQSVGVIMGANIGTTVTAWLISIIGFKVKISALAFPLIGIGFPLIFSKSKKISSWGEVVFGFSILFIGLDSLKSSVPNIHNSPEIFSFLAHYTNMGFGSVLIFLAIGTILTIVIQSSSATMALTLVMCNNGWIPFELAAAMVLGENIGTTITANIAALVANVSAKRAARAHLIFNLIGVIWVLSIFPFFLNMIDSVSIMVTGNSPFKINSAIPIALSLFHTIFNITNVLLLIGFSKFIVKIVKKLVPVKKDEDEEFRLQYISMGMLSTSELSTLQAKNEIASYAKHTKKMFGFVKKLFDEKNEKNFNKLYEKSIKYEDISDNIEVEIASYLTKISEGDLSTSASVRISSMLKIVSDIESIADSCYNLTKACKRKFEQKEPFQEFSIKNIHNMFQLIDEALDTMIYNLEHDYHLVSLKKANEIEKRINEYRTELKQEHLNNIKTKKYTYQSGVIYNDIFLECEKLGDYIINISEALNEIK